MDLKVLRDIYSPPRELLTTDVESVMVKTGVMEKQESDTESHEFWHDIYIVTSGEGVLLEADSMHGAEDTGEGEKRRGQLKGVKEHNLKEGTIVFIPAGCPHMVKVPDRLTMVVLKLKKKAV